MASELASVKACLPHATGAVFAGGKQIRDSSVIKVVGYPVFDRQTTTTVAVVC